MSDRKALLVLCVHKLLNIYIAWTVNATSKQLRDEMKKEAMQMFAFISALMMVLITWLFDVAAERFTSVVILDSDLGLETLNWRSLTCLGLNMIWARPCLVLRVRWTQKLFPRPADRTFSYYC